MQGIALRAKPNNDLAQAPQLLPQQMWERRADHPIAGFFPGAGAMADHAFATPVA